MLAKRGISATCSDIFGVAGSAWLDTLGLPQPYVAKVTSFAAADPRNSPGRSPPLSEVIEDLLAGDRCHQVIQQPAWDRPVLAAVVTDEIGNVSRFRDRGSLLMDGADPAVLAAAALGGHRGDPAGARGLGGRCCQGRGKRSPQHRQGRRHTPAPYPGVLLSARRADPLPAQIPRRPTPYAAACAGGMNGLSWPAARREVAPPVSEPPPSPGGAGVPLIDPPS